MQVKNDAELSVFFQEKLSKGSKPLESLISLQFGHFFNSYTQAFNKVYQRNGSLFTPNFKRKEIANEEYLREVILYVHLNPVIHGIANDYKSYLHSSYKSIVSKKKTSLKRKEVVKLFDDLENLEYVHESRKMNEELLNLIISEDD